ncbi:hypothetical protein NDU88_003649 [Pleurodeles waltl]|uniref:Uncharacterized protein n=1 Tax=Pleurodeles waltl TaxID=8319 RepID=A0AAV7UZ04_PLEWA|nr:hypothetical protein NDU88_003649 [Pleurodeles waltl]
MMPRLQNTVQRYLEQLCVCMWMSEEVELGGDPAARQASGSEAGVLVEAAWGIRRRRCFSSHCDLRGPRGSRGVLVLEEMVKGKWGLLRAQMI